MWERVFDGENRFWQALSRLGSLIVLNLLTLICALPLVTAGASLTAAAAVLGKTAEDREPGIVCRAFFRAFRQNFRQATAAWLIALAALLVLTVDLLYSLSASGALAVFFRIFAILGYAATGSVLVWLFALIARYENPLKTHFENALRLAVGCLPRTLLLLAMWLLPPLACALSYELMSVLAPVWMLIGFSGIAYLSALLRRRTFEGLS